MSSRPTAIGASLFAAEPDRRWPLPRKLREISGLALTPDGRVMGHDDEAAVVFELDIERGEVVKRFALGDPAPRDDFEGLAIGGNGDFYLTSSTGFLYRFREGEDRARVDFDLFDTGLRNVGEVEGLAFQSAEERVIFACKINYSAAMQGALSLHAWAPWTPEQPARPWLTLPAYAFARAVGAKSFHPSAFEIDARSGRLIVLAALENAMIELDAEGTLLAARRLGPHHRQPEGVTILADGALVIADEGGDAHSMMTRYPRRHD
ncbi:MAG: hypothetical protein ACHP7N_05050 [Caulobacterales bacterium]